MVDPVYLRVICGAHRRYCRSSLPHESGNGALAVGSVVVEEIEGDLVIGYLSNCSTDSLHVTVHPSGKEGIFF